MELGLDGILYAGLGGERFLFTDQEFEEYIMPFDKQIMKACLEAGGHNILHMCKTDVNLTGTTVIKDFTALPIGASMRRE